MWKHLGECVVAKFMYISITVLMHTCTPSISGTSNFLHIWKFPHIALFADKSCIWMSQHLLSLPISTSPSPKLLLFFFSLASSFFIL